MAALSLAYLLLVTLFIAWLANAQATEVVGMDVVSAENGLAGDFHHGASKPYRKIVGRKMAPAVNNGRTLGIKRNGATGEASKISSPTKMTGNYDNKGDKEFMNVGHKPRVGQSSEDDNEAGFVAYNADYHSPRHHPPKNN